jgi:hypothetical protein
MWKRLLWQRTGGHYLFWLSAIYLIVGFTNIAYKFTEAEYIQMVWILCLMIPLVIKPVASWLNMRTIWER